MAKMKVSDLEGAELDYWVAKAKGLEAKQSKTHPEHGYKVYVDSVSCWIFSEAQDEDDVDSWSIFEPSWMWHDGGPIMEREKIDIEHGNELVFASTQDYLPGMYGPTPLIAAMRAFVSSKFGEEVNG